MHRENEIAMAIVDAAYQVHRILGPGLLESAYEAVLVHELRKRGLVVAAQVPVPVVYESVRLEAGFRADLIVEDLVIVELKSLEKIAPVHKKQLTTYLKPVLMYFPSHLPLRPNKKARTKRALLILSRKCHKKPSTQP